MKSEILVKETGQPISLAEATKIGPAKFSETKHKRKEVDLSELRRTLEEALDTELSSNKPKEPLLKNEEMADRPSTPNCEPPIENQSQSENQANPKQGTLEPGKTVEL